LDPNDNINVSEILDDLEHYHPRRHGWTWRTPAPGLKLGQFTYEDCSEPLKSSVPLPPAHYFGDIDPQPLPTITTEIASGRFEDDIRRMRLAAHHGADHIMVIRTAGQSHFDGLIEGSPQGMGGSVLLRKYPAHVHTVYIADRNELADADTPEALAQLEALARQKL